MFAYFTKNFANLIQKVTFVILSMIIDVVVVRSGAVLLHGTMEITPKTAAKFKSVYSTPENNSEDGSPCVSSAERSKPKLSASLRERLKRSRRSFTSPFPVAKRLCVDDEEEDGAQQVSANSRQTVNNPPVIGHIVDQNKNVLGSSSDSCSLAVSNQSLDLTQQRDQLRREVREKTEALRRLKMVKMYRSKNDLTQLQNLIDKWRRCAQSALYELQSEVTKDGKKASLTELIDLFGLDDKILHFDRTEEDFCT